MARKQTKTAAQALFPQTEETKMADDAGVVVETVKKERSPRVLKDKKVFVWVNLTDADGNPLPKGTVKAEAIGTFTTDQVDEAMACQDANPNAHRLVLSIKMSKAD